MGKVPLAGCFLLCMAASVSAEEPAWIVKVGPRLGSAEKEYVSAAWFALGLGLDFISLNDQVQVGIEGQYSFGSRYEETGRGFNLFGNLTYWPGSSSSRVRPYIGGGLGLTWASYSGGYYKYPIGDSGNAFGFHTKGGVLVTAGKVGAFWEVDFTHAFADEQNLAFSRTGLRNSVAISFGVRIRATP